MLQNQPYQHLIWVAFRLVLRQRDDTTKHPMLNLSNAAEACGLGQALSANFIGIAGENGEGMCKVDEEVDFFLRGIVAEYLNGLVHSHGGASGFMVTLPVAGYPRQHHVLQEP